MTELERLKRDITNIQNKHRERPEMMRGSKSPFYRRGEMSIPAFRMRAGEEPEKEGREQSLRVMNKAVNLPIDLFFYDLEDAAPDNPEFKKYARQFIVEALQTNDYGERLVAFRPNGIRTPYFEDDMLEIISKVGDKLDAIIIPKTEYADEIEDIIKIVKDIQRLSGHENKLWLEVLFESPRAFLEAEKIAALDDVAALVFGAWDFARTIGGKVTVEGWLQQQAVARQTLPIIASAYGKDAVDSVTVTLPLRPKKPDYINDEEYKKVLSLHSSQIDKDIFGEDFIKSMERKEFALDLVRRDAENARAIGYSAKWILHPDQIAPIHRAWTPNKKEAFEALELAIQYARAARSGSGAEVDYDRLADKAVVGTDWWIVHAAVHSGIISKKEIETSGFTYKELQRAVVNHDEHSNLEIKKKS